jgi:hypothetical protein
MATTTTNFGWDIPQSTDLVKDGATAIAALGQDIDTAMVDLKGGTTGQVLAKASGTDLDFSWVAQDDSNAIQNAIVDAKGDIIAATANDTPARLAVGTNGQVLTADSTAATGLKWAAATATTTFVGCSLKSSTDQTVSNNTYTALTWDQENFDTDGFHSVSSNTSRITIPSGKAGYYSIHAWAQSDNNATGSRTYAFFKNGVLFTYMVVPASTQYPSGQLSAVMNLAVGDYIEYFVYQDSGASRSIAKTSGSGGFNAFLIGA